MTTQILSPCVQDQGHLAFLHVNWRISQLLSRKYPWSLPLNCRCLSLSDPIIGQHWILWSRIEASSLYAGLVYIGCWMYDTFFHHSFKACRKNMDLREWKVNSKQSNLILEFYPIWVYKRMRRQDSICFKRSTTNHVINLLTESELKKSNNQSLEFMKNFHSIALFPWFILLAYSMYCWGKINEERTQ